MRKTKAFIFILILQLAGCQQTAKRADISNQPVVDAQKTSPAFDERALRLVKIKDSVAPFFELMGKPDEYDWLAHFNEPGQTFEEYINGNPALPTDARRIVYIQPVGDFTASQRRVLEQTADYLSAFFNLPVKMNELRGLGNIPDGMQRVLPRSGQRQIKTGYFLENLLPPMLSEDAAALICFTNEDLYPGDEWYFVFGQATLEKRVGVWSLSRLGNPDKSENEYRKFLARTLKIAMHETGHMFSMLHCTKYECLMSGSNHLGETDRHPLDVCPECMAKISWAMNYEPSTRYRKLAEFSKRQNWMDEEKSFIAKAEAVEKASK
jgi:archaemetzincin